MQRWLIGALLLTLGCVVFAACGGSDNQSSSVGSSSVSSAGAQTVHVTEGDMSIKSDVASFTVGTPYHFVIKNEGAIEHEFTIVKKMAATSEKVRDAQALKDVDGIQPGKEATLDLTFKDPAPPSGMEFECSVPGHYEMGMHMDITVK
jgi:uncharacterized cupredoxin-like copper-binding protein